MVSRRTLLCTEPTATLVHHIIITILGEQAVLCVLGGTKGGSGCVTRECIINVIIVIVIVVIGGRGLRKEKSGGCELVIAVRCVQVRSNTYRVRGSMLKHTVRLCTDTILFPHTAKKACK